MGKIRFIIIGSGWRSLFYVRIAQYLPESFECCAMLCRTPEKASLIQDKYNVHTTLSVDECLSLKPDFAVVAVSKESIYEVSREWLLRGIPVLCETPLGQTEDEIIKAYRLFKDGYKIQVAEQYHRYPFYESLIKLCGSGIIGEPYNITLSAIHDYHAASIIRKILNKGTERVRIYGKAYEFPVVDTLSRYEAFFDGRTSVKERCRLTLEYEDGKVGFYDFCGVQYRSTIRKKLLNIQGVKGEVMNTCIQYLDRDYLPHESSFDIQGNKNYIESISFECKELYKNIFSAKMPQDETAIAKIMIDMKRFAETGKEGYGIKEALTDSLYSVKMHEALSHPGREIICDPTIIS